MVTKRLRGPNVLVLGTPGTGKSTLCKRILEKTNVNHINVSQLISEKKLYKEWDDEFECSIYDEDLLLDELETFDFESGGFLVEFHSCDIFSDNLFDNIIVLRTDIETLSKRLEERNYTNEKIDENLQSEIFQVVLDDANDVFDKNKVVQFQSNTMKEMETVVDYAISLFQAQ
ncbi:hypothetical protein BEWA_019170 [Theileria equi strain WA]|uniref:Adenylate kinase isoenzyme 6 homolog n=1 Tax=Theileria equi strain WA TaxID=1537102 RepID=L0ATU8_THEEQ|nr:hypothetical protein BEWA_019170 [Theileria equi strain WA]AFZ79072.1 hypothetical protein BEWA_019170 [Theileria equi strain WA]|eukprot:XP_004828738.1 hypothetical protein BEWA_019170 [Theileria equi strain WA]